MRKSNDEWFFYTGSFQACLIHLCFFFFLFVWALRLLFRPFKQGCFLEPGQPPGVYGALFRVASPLPSPVNQRKVLRNEEIDQQLEYHGFKSCQLNIALSTKICCASLPLKNVSPIDCHHNLLRTTVVTEKIESKTSYWCQTYCQRTVVIQSVCLPPPWTIGTCTWCTATLRLWFEPKTLEPKWLWRCFTDSWCCQLFIQHSQIRQ